MKLTGMVDVPDTVLDTRSPVGALNLREIHDNTGLAGLEVIGKPPQHIAIADQLLHILLNSDLTSLFVTALEGKVTFHLTTGPLTYRLGEQEAAGEYAGCWHAYLDEITTLTR